MNEFIKKNWGYIVSCFVFSATIAYGLSEFIDFFKGICLIAPFSALLLYFLDTKMFSNKEAEQVIQGLDQIIGEQSQVIEEYEKIFDAQLVHLPCVCGGNTFEGLFSPKLENIVECEKCKNKYRVNVNYDSVLISEPMDINKTFDELISP